MDSFAGYVTISTNVRCYYYVVYNSFVFHQDCALVHLAFNTVQYTAVMQNSQISFS